MEENVEYFSDAQKKAELFRRAYQETGAPGTADFKALTRVNLVRYNNIAATDIDPEERSHGAGTGGIKVKSTIDKPLSVVSNLTKIPDGLLRMNEEVIMHLDGLFLNGFPFVTTVLHGMCVMKASMLMSDKFYYMHEIVNEACNTCRESGFQIVEIHAYKFQKALNKFSEGQLCRDK